MIDLGPLHFLRPEWLWALLALPVLALWLRRRRDAGADWRRAVDPHLLPFLLEPGRASRQRWLGWLAALAYLIATVALAGPAWRRIEQPLWQTRLPVVVAVDLSSASLATDVAPSRVAQMQARLRRLLQSSPEGPIGLVAFADDAFTVAPITDDAANVALFVDALQPDVMPVDGQSPARAIEWSRELIERAGYRRGRIVLVTDRADAAAQQAAVEAHAAGHVVSTLGLGSSDGATVRMRNGRDVPVALDEASLRQLARSGGGMYAPLSLDGGDDAVFAAVPTGGRANGRGGRDWADEGFRLLPPLLLLALVVLVRRPRAAVALLAIALVPRPSFAADPWLRPDQQAHRAIERGIERYRRGDFEAAAEEFAKADGADAHYDRGNALAKAGRLQEAVSAYDEALRRRPGMPDAVANRQSVLNALKRKPPSGGQQQGQKGGTSKQSQQPRACKPGDPSCQSQPKQPSPQSDAPSRNEPQRSQAPQPPKPSDPSRQARADAAQRERMERALQQAKAAQKPSTTPVDPRQRERRLSDDAALQRVPDEPGSLLREKFRLEHERRQLGGRR